MWFDVLVPGDGVHAVGGGGEIFNSCEPWLRYVSDGLLFELGFVQSLSAILSAFLSAHACALALVGNPCFVRFLPSGERYWTRHMCPLFVAYFLMEAMLN